MIVSGHAQSLKKRLSEARDLRAVQAIETAANRGENLTRQLLAFARTLPLDPTVLSLPDTVQAIRDVLAGTMHVNIAFAIDVPADTWPVRVDKSELDLALVNLAVNARDAMPDGGTIAIYTENVRLDANDAPERRRRRLRGAARRRYRLRHSGRIAAAGGRAVLHHQRPGEGHRPRPVPGLRPGAPVRRRGANRQRSRSRHHGDGLPAAQPRRR